jgi:hypothetical protein
VGSGEENGLIDVSISQSSGGWGGKAEEREGIKRECSIQSKRQPRRLEVIGTIQ